MSDTSTVNNILILAGDTKSNLGDMAILHATCHDLLSIKPDLTIHVISKTKPAIADLKNVRSVRPGMLGFFHLIFTAARADIVLCGGGGLFQDDDSLIKMPYWAARLLLVRLFCNNIVGYSLGVGPLSAASSRWSARLAFACMRRISTRDPFARDTAQKLTNKPIIVVPDPALLLQPATEQQAKDLLARYAINELNKPLIGVAVRRWFPAMPRLIPNKIASKFRSKSKTEVRQSEQLCGNIAKVLDQLAQKHDAYIVFMPTYNVSHESDDKLCLDIMQRMSTNTCQLLHIDTPQLYKAVSSHLDVLLCGRMHPSIFSAAAGTPVAGLAYNPKFKGFFSLLDMEDYVMDVSDFVSHDLIDEMVEITSNALTKSPDIKQKLEILKDDIHSFNRLILGAA